MNRDNELLVVLQTHSKSNSQKGLVRYCGAPKIEVSSRCVFSLIDSLNYAAKHNPNTKIQLQIFDDHSDEEFLIVLNKLISIAKFPVNLESLETYGIMPSILRCYEHGKEYGKDWVYFMQDDYLLQQNSIDLMLYAIEEFSKNLGKPASIHAFNDPWEYYMPENVAVPCHIVISKDRYWRTNIHVPFSLMTHISIIKNNWDLFYKMGTSEVSGVMEFESISRLYYQRGYTAFTPIPSLALHMQAETEKDPFIDWKSWWNEYDLEKLNEKN
jgi:hypothetical protein